MQLMTSLRQIEANRDKALKSTGPKTKNGKQRSRRNALRHGFTVAAIHTPPWRVQRIAADGREVPCPQARNVIEASPLDPAANFAGALRAPADRRSLCVVSWPEISKQFQKVALMFRRTFPRP